MINMRKNKVYNAVGRCFVEKYKRGLSKTPIYRSYDSPYSKVLVEELIKGN